MADHPKDHKSHSANRKVASAVVRGSLKAADLLREFKKAVAPVVTAVTSPVKRSRKAQVDRQIDIDVQKRPASETFKRSTRGRGRKR